MDRLTKETGCSGSHGLRIVEIFKQFGDQTALGGVSFDVADQEIVALLGPSGCGKSTVLAVIAGLERPEGGVVCWNGEDLQDTPTYQRGFGLMFQDFALFPHQDTYDNIAFGLKMQGASNTEIKERVGEVLKLVGLPEFGARDVNTLSGGEAQRVALARALAPHPRLLMLDEPLGALDRNLRERLMVELRTILRASRQTAIYVTHDQEEAFAVADRIVLMNAGQVVQSGAPVDIYRRPKSAFVARFLGMDNLMPGMIIPMGETAGVETPIGVFRLDQDGMGAGFHPPEEVQVLLRPDAVYLDGNEGVSVRGVIRQISFRGNISRAEIEIGKQSFHFDFPAHVDLPPIGAELELGFDPKQAIQILRN